LGRRRPWLALTLHTQALAQTVRVLGRAFALAPALAGAPVTLALAFGSTANVLPIPGPWMRTKPMPADPARSLAAHVVLRKQIGAPHRANWIRSMVGQF
jgi:hypothetical protein